MPIIIITHILIGVATLIIEMIPLKEESFFVVHTTLAVIFACIYIFIGMKKYKVNSVGISAVLLSTSVIVPVLGELNILPSVCRAVSGGSIMFGYAVVNGLGWENIEKFPVNIMGVIAMFLGTSMFTCIGINIGRRRHKEEYRAYLEIKKQKKTEKEAENGGAS